MSTPIQRRVESLVSSDPEMRDAVETVLDTAVEGEVQWVEVRDDISSGQWGRLIEQGVLEDGESGFELADRDAVEEALTDDDDTDIPEVEGEAASWSVYDKAAALATGGFFIGYTYAPVRDLVGGTVDAVLGPLQAAVPFYAVVMVIAVFTGVYSTLLRANLMDMERMSAYQERMQEIQDRRKEAKERGDDEALQQIQEEQMDAMGDQLGMFKEQFRPMVWIMFFTIPAFLWMYWKVGIRGAASHGEFSNIVLPLIGEVTWTTAVVGPIQTWIVWYFLCSMAFTQLVQKGLDVKMSPT
ncbi:MAG: putative membrane protein [halophilic archaeon J07HB67]|jgi:Predicted membrane protein|nr:MAG: putative membrane protein [halophilic archaeon J07HB67]